MNECKTDHLPVDAFTAAMAQIEGAMTLLTSPQIYDGGSPGKSESSRPFIQAAVSLMISWCQIHCHHMCRK